MCGVVGKPQKFSLHNEYSHIEKQGWYSHINIAIYNIVATMLQPCN